MTPQWVTQERRAKLVELSERYGNVCLKGHQMCSVRSHYQWVNPHTEWAGQSNGGAVKVTVWEWEPVLNLAEAKMHQAVADWKEQDRAQRVADWKREQRSLHDGTKGRFGHPFDPVARDVFMAQRPEYYLKAEGMDLVRFRPIAVVRVPSTDKRLHVDVSAAFVKPTKGQRRHARRHGKPVQEVTVTVETLCQKAVQAWWSKRS